MFSRINTSVAMLIVMAAATSTTFTDADAADAALPKTMPVEAQGGSDVAWAFTTRVISDYNFFGLTNSNHQPAAQAYAELQFFDNFAYIAGAVSSTYLPTQPSPPAEIDAFGGFRPKWGDLVADIGVGGFFYMGEHRFVLDDIVYSPASINFVLAYSKFSYTAGDYLLGANLFYSPNYGGGGSQATYTAGTARYNIPEKALGFLPAGLSISAEAGRFEYWNRSDSLVFARVKFPSYFYGNVGLSYTFDKFTLDLRYHDTTVSKRGCFTLTGDPRGAYSGSGRSNWCGSAIIGSIQFDISSANAGVFDSSKPLETVPPR